MRLFFAIGLPPAIIEAIASTQEELKQSMADSGVRWTRPESIHLTLKFIGEWKADMVAELTAAAAPAVKKTTPFDIRIAELGAFPSGSKPRVLWLGVHGEGEVLGSLAADLERALETCGVPKERRRFSPHLTLARARRGAGTQTRDGLRRLLQETSIEALGQFRAHTVSLYESRLNPQGAIYRTIADFEMAES